MYDEEPDEEDRRSRFHGLMMLGVGFLCVGIFIGIPIYQARDGAKEVRILQAGVVIGAMVMVVGINQVAFGRKAVDLFALGDMDLRDITKLQWFLLALALGGGVALSLGLMSYLHALGFTDKVPGR
jgi:hypothetical protein